MNAINDNALQDASQDFAMPPDMYNRVCRNADIERWRSQDFVLGYEIKRSKNCDCDCEICRIGSGIYPLEFEWSGWHDGCRCYVTPILIDESVMSSLQDVFLAGGDYKAALQQERDSRKIVDIPFALFARIIQESRNEGFLNQNWVKNNINLIMDSGKRQYESFKYEYPNQVRIFDDCNRLMRTTTNYDVFVRRANGALDFINWIHNMKDAGFPVKINMGEAVVDFNRVFNRHSLRIARTMAEAACTPCKAKNVIPNIESVKAALKESDNKSECESEINTLIFNLNIDANGK